MSVFHPASLQRIFMISGLMCSTLLALGCGGGSSSHSNDVGTTGVVTVIPPTTLNDNFWMAYQDGDGPWQVAEPRQGTFTFSVKDPAGRFGVVLVEETPDPSGGSVPSKVLGRIFQLTRQEVARIDLSNLSQFGTSNVTGNVVASVGTDVISLQMRDSARILPLGATSFAFNAPMGQADLMALRQPNGGLPDRLFMVRNQTITGPGNLPTLDFNQAWPLLLQAAHVTGIAPDETIATSVKWITPTTSISLCSGGLSNWNPNLPFDIVVPAIQTPIQDPGDFYEVTVHVSNIMRKHRLAGGYSKTAAGMTIPLPPAVTDPSFGIIPGSPYYRPVFAWAPLSGTLRTQWLVQASSSMKSWDVSISAGWLAGNSTSNPTYPFPDFSTLSGWKNTWGISHGDWFQWYYYNHGSTSPDPGWYTGGTRAYANGALFWSSWTTDLPVYAY